MQDANSGKNVQALKGVFWLDNIASVCFHRESLN